MNEIMKLHRSILRRIYLKFLILQNNYKSTTGSPTTPGIKTSTSGDTNDVGKINLSILIEFIQHGRIINVHREQTQQSLLKK